jgi:hypothetical protein
MTERQVASAAALDAPSGPELVTASDTPILVTEQEVVFGTAAAVPLRPGIAHWWIRASHVVLQAIRRTSLTSTAKTRPARRHYPSRLTYLEHSYMKREIRRL